MFHGAAGKIAKEIEHLIDTERLNGRQRRDLANVLSHMGSVAADPSHWSNAETKLDQSLATAGIHDRTDPVVAHIVHKMRELAHLVSFRHRGMVESNVRKLRESSDPDALVLKSFRTKLAETRDAQHAAIRTARMFAIDVDDVISIVREAAKCKKIMEDDVQNVPMFPVGASQPAVTQPAVTQPQTQVGVQQPNNSTRKPLTPADKRAQVAQQNANAQGNAATNMPSPPAGGTQMVPPTEADQNVPDQQKPQMAPVQNAAKPKMPGKVVQPPMK
jgi:hypothetical protein